MRAYGQVHSQFWIDTQVNTLSSQAKFLAIYLLAGPQTSMIGCFRTPLGYIAADLKLDIAIVKQLLNELVAIDFLYYDPTTEWLLIYDFLKWNPIMNPNQGKLAKKLIEMIPKESSVLPKLLDSLLLYGKHIDEKSKKKFEMVSKLFQNQEQDQEHDQQQEQDPNIHVKQNTLFLEIKATASNIIDNMTTAKNGLIENNAENSGLDDYSLCTLTPHQKRLAIEEIFEHWKNTFNHKKTVLNEVRYNTITEALDRGFSVDQLLTAINGCALTPHNQGNNEQDKVYDGLEVIFKHADNIERFIRNAENPPATAKVVSQQEQAIINNINTMNSWLNTKPFRVIDQ